MTRAISINNSMREAFKSCPRKVLWGYVAGIEPKRKSLPLIVGTAYHKGLEYWRGFKGQNRQAAIEEAIAKLAADLSAIEYSEEAIQDECSKLGAYLSGYFDVYAGDIPSMGGWNIEKKLELTHEHGTLDAFFTDRNNLTWVLDDKTRSELAPDIELMLPMNEQLLNYGCLLQDFNYKVGGFIWREVKKSRHKRLKAETAQQFRARVMAEYVGSTGIANYRETIVKIEPIALDIYREHKDWMDKTIKSVMKFQGATWPHNSQACNGPYGTCEFLKLCAGVRDAAETYFKPSERGEPLDGGSFQRTIWPKTTTTGALKLPTTTPTPSSSGGSLPEHGSEPKLPTGCKGASCDASRYH